QAYLDAGGGVISTIGACKVLPTGKTDIAVVKTVSRQGEEHTLGHNYTHVIVDEILHTGAPSFDAILRRTKAKCVLGLTATPIRRDGQQPIIFMQCGPIRHTAARSTDAPRDLEVTPRIRSARVDLPPESGIQEVFRRIASDPSRTAAIAAEAREAFYQGRKVLVLTERTEHLDAIRAALGSAPPRPFVLHGRMSRRQRATLIAELSALTPD